jgi:hypothetical protein
MITAIKHRVAAKLILASSLATIPLFASADHSWSTYHWGSSQTPFTVQLRDRLSAPWKGTYDYLLNSATEWSNNSAIRTSREQTAGGFNTKRCPPSSGVVEICNDKYGNNGWLGIAQVWLSGGHITQGTVKLNDTYFNTAKYNQQAWRRLVMCQEIGHTIGLDHVDETFDNVNAGTCMDYTNDPAGTTAKLGPKSNEMPDAHDYEQLTNIYVNTHTAHTTGQTVNNASAAVDKEPGGESPGEWGALVRSTNAGFTERYERELGGGRRLVTFVIWTEDRIRGQRR